MSSSVNLPGIVAGATVMTYDPSILCRDDTFRYIVSLDAIRKKHEDLPSWVQITTITMTCKLLASERINLDLIREAFRKEGSIRIRRKGALCDGHMWTMKETTFYNQVTIGYMDQYSTKSIKVFPNGSFQVAGCSDLYDCQRVSKQLSFLLSSILQLPEPLTAEAFRVVMINTNFALNRPVNLNTIIEKLSIDPMFEVSFNPDRYSAVKIKFKPRPEMKQVTASVFSTGKIIVTGAETLKEIAFAYDVLNTKLKNMAYDNTPFLNILEEVEKKPDYEKLRDACIDAASYYLKDDDDELWSIEDGDFEAMFDVGQRIAKEMANRKKSTSSDTVLGAKFGSWVKTLKARGVISWL
jgi:TATA-box binding protein (TBP) (component of TFIID and TFIIIB)